MTKMSERGTNCGLESQASQGLTVSQVTSGESLTLSRLHCGQQQGFNEVVPEKHSGSSREVTSLGVGGRGG